eukprot:TRINITY_DN16300_c0_g1_i1.p1 TRINITY_DN16300_c0_g1~~TRINITY_DN16300_c0_g1_i1.p1  ORF type:complete len:65 (-),score=13.13 TRINITY_DN16300_c0_g1_i1:105-299(-)
MCILSPYETWFTSSRDSEISENLYLSQLEDKSKVYSRIAATAKLNQLDLDEHTLDDLVDEIEEV